MWRNWKFWTLLLRMQNGAATMENSMEVPQKIENRTTCDCWISLLGMIQRCEIRILKRYQCCYVHCSIIHKSQYKETKYPSADEWVKKRWSVHTMECYSALKRKKFCSYDNTEDTWDHYVKWNKPVTETQMLHESTYVKDLKRSNSEDQRLKGWQPQTGRWEDGALLINRHKISGKPDELALESYLTTSYQ